MQQSLKKIRPFFLVALLLILVWQQWITFQKYENNFEHPKAYFSGHDHNDLITEYGKRYTDIKSYFQHPTHISYIGEAGENFGTGAFNYVLSQYYLSPNLVYKSSPIRDTILYNLYTSKELDAASNYYLNHGWHLLKDFNNGLILLSK
jgi:hypothetical protein